MSSVILIRNINNNAERLQHPKHTHTHPYVASTQLVFPLFMMMILVCVSFVLNYKRTVPLRFGSSIAAVSAIAKLLT